MVGPEALRFNEILRTAPATLGKEPEIEVALIQRLGSATFLLAHFERHPAPVSRPHVRRLGPDDAVERLLLEAVGRPARDPRYRECRGEELRGQPEPVQQ